MGSFMDKIKRYSSDMFDFEVSPFEMHYGLFVRSELERKWNEMTNEEQLFLTSVDLQVIQNAEKIVGHLNEIYDFSTSNEPESEWWWHLDKVISREIVIKGNLFVEKNIAL